MAAPSALVASTSVGRGLSYSLAQGLPGTFSHSSNENFKTLVLAAIETVYWLVVPSSATTV